MASHDMDCPDWDDCDWEHVLASHSEPECHAASDAGYDSDCSTWLLLDQPEVNTKFPSSKVLVVGSLSEVAQEHQHKAQANINEIPDLTHPLHTATTAETQTCPHWLDTKCQLTSMSHQRSSRCCCCCCCCACSDRRPHTASGLYEAYVDGTGWVESAERWEYYCHGCKAAGRASRAILSSTDKRAIVEGYVDGKDAEPHPVEPTPTTTSTNPTDPPLTVLNDTSSCERQSHSHHKLFITARRHNTFTIPPTQRGLLHQNTRCGHWVSRACQLTTTRGECCQCSDARDHGASTSASGGGDGSSSSGGGGKNKDGNGSVAKTCVYYCPACKVHLLQSHSDSRTSSSTRASIMAAALLRQYAGMEPAHRETQLAQHEHERYPEQRHQRPQGQQHQNDMKLAAHAYAQQQQKAPPKNGCNHWLPNACSLTGKSQQYCCACSDKRSLARAYVKYVDGLDGVLVAARWEYYCPGCRDAGMRWAWQ